MLWAKQSAAATLIVGPILDSAGAEYTGAVIGDISISKNGGTLTALASAATLTHIANGQYTLVLTTGNTDTLGRAQFTCNKSTYQCAMLELMVLPATVFDAFVTNAAGGANGLLLSLASNQVDVGKILGTAVSTPATAGILDVNVKNIDNDAASASGTVTFPNATLASTTNITAGTITTATNVTTVNGLAANVITATSINADAITAAKVADGTIDAATFAAGAINAAAIATDAITAAKIAADAIGASELAADAVTEIQSGLATPTNITAASGVALTAAYDPAKTASQAGDAMALTSGERTTLAGVFWAVATTALTTAGSIGKRLVDFVTSLVYAAAPTSAANASATAAQITTDHGAGSYIRNTEPLDAAGTRTAIGLTAANLDTQLGNILTSADDANTNASLAHSEATNASTNISVVLSRLGAFTGSGLNTVLGFFRAIWNKQSGLTPSDLTSGVTLAGDRGDNTTDSLPAIRDRGDAAWTTGSGGGGGDCPTTDEIVDALAASGVNINRAVVAGTITLWVNADYTIAHDRSVDVTVPAGTSPNLENADHIYLGVKTASNNTLGFTIEASEVDGSDTLAQTLKFEPNHTDHTTEAKIDPTYSYVGEVLAVYLGTPNVYEPVMKLKVIIEANRVTVPAP